MKKIILAVAMIACMPIFIESSMSKVNVKILNKFPKSSAQFIFYDGVGDKIMSSTVNPEDSKKVELAKPVNSARVNYISRKGRPASTALIYSSLNDKSSDQTWTFSSTAVLSVAQTTSVM